MPALRTPGAVRIIGSGGKAHSLDEIEVENLRLLTAGAVNAQPSRYLPAGSTVRLVDGPLAGLTGRVTQVRSQKRFVVSLDLLQRSVEVELHGTALQPSSPMAERRLTR